MQATANPGRISHVMEAIRALEYACKHWDEGVPYRRQRLMCEICAFALEWARQEKEGTSE